MAKSENNKVKSTKKNSIMEFLFKENAEPENVQEVINDEIVEDVIEETNEDEEFAIVEEELLNDVDAESNEVVDNYTVVENVQENQQGPKPLSLIRPKGNYGMYWNGFGY